MSFDPSIYPGINENIIVVLIARMVVVIIQKNLLNVLQIIKKIKIIKSMMMI